MCAGIYAQASKWVDNIHAQTHWQAVSALLLDSPHCYDALLHIGHKLIPPTEELIGSNSIMHSHCLETCKGGGSCLWEVGLPIIDYLASSLKRCFLPGMGKCSRQVVVVIPSLKAYSSKLTTHRKWWKLSQAPTLDWLASTAQWGDVWCDTQTSDLLLVYICPAYKLS